jgi:large subunit ribosomal protein L29
MKTADLQNLSEIELRDRLVEETNTYQKAKLTHAISPLENPSSLKGMRRLVARINTEIRRRELDSLIK